MKLVFAMVVLLALLAACGGETATNSDEIGEGGAPEATATIRPQPTPTLRPPETMAELCYVLGARVLENEDRLTGCEIVEVTGKGTSDDGLWIKLEYTLRGNGMSQIARFAQIETAELLHAVSQAPAVESDRVEIVGTIPVVDKFGNEKVGDIFIASWWRSDIDRKINWANFDSRNVFDLARAPQMADAFAAALP